MSVAVRELVKAIEGQAQYEGSENRIRLAVLIMALTAYGNSMIGPHIREMLGEEDGAARQLLTRLLPLFLVPSPIIDP